MKSLNRHQPYEYHDLGFLDSRTLEKKMLFKPLILWYFVIAA